MPFGPPPAPPPHQNETKKMQIFFKTFIFWSTQIIFYFFIFFLEIWILVIFKRCCDQWRRAVFISLNAPNLYQHSPKGPPSQKSEFGRPKNEKVFKKNSTSFLFRRNFLHHFDGVGWSKWSSLVKFQKYCWSKKKSCIFLRPPLPPPF